MFFGTFGKKTCFKGFLEITQKLLNTQKKNHR